jgi:cardiolipin synthase
VLIDGFGRMYSWPRAHRRLKKGGVPFAIYLPPSILPPRFTINLRNHRKILVIDGELAFTGGMNIRQDHLIQSASKRRRSEDIHFRVRGPVVQQLQQVFVGDWRFSSNLFINPRPYPQSVISGGACCRVISDGPNDDIDKLVRILIGAIGAAKQSVLIMTPYFLPEKSLQMALEMAALRGVRVRIILPGKNNMPFVNWAAFHILGGMLECGVEVYLSGGSFVHSKLFVVDDYYAQVGSFNLDARSLKLNFEVAVESFSEEVAAPLVAHFEASVSESSVLTSDKLARRSALQRFNGALFWLMSPYL